MGCPKDNRVNGYLQEGVRPFYIGKSASMGVKGEQSESIGICLSVEQGYVMFMWLSNVNMNDCMREIARVKAE